jgi:hypothetical protein
MDDSQQGQGHGAVLTVEAKVVGQRKPAISGWQVPLPALLAADRADTGGYPRLRDLLAGIVRQEALAFRQRQGERRLVRVLSPAGIQQVAATGKIDMGGPRELQAETEVDDDAAVAVALQAFEDGLYFVFLDGQQQEDLDAEVRLRPDSTLTFIRLVALAGG